MTKTKLKVVHSYICHTESIHRILHFHLPFLGIFSKVNPPPPRAPPFNLGGGGGDSNCIVAVER